MLVYGCKCGAVIATSPYELETPPTICLTCALAVIDDLQAVVRRATGKIAHTGKVEQPREWQQTPQSAYCMGLEQLNRILVGLVREYGSDGKLTISNGVSAGVAMGAQVRWCCTGRSKDHIVIQESEPCKPKS